MRKENMDTEDRIDRIIKKIMEARIANSIASEDCPSEVTISCYLDNLLNEKEKEAIEKHFFSCERCLDELILMKKLAKEEVLLKPPELLIDRAKGLSKGKEGIFDVIVSLIREMIKNVKNFLDITGLSQKLAPAALRGKKRKKSSQKRSFVKKLKDLDLEIDVEKRAKGLLNLKVRALSKSKKSIRGLRISLRDKTRELASAIVEDGELTFENLEPKNYYIRISKKGESLGEFSLNLH